MIKSSRLIWTFKYGEGFYGPKVLGKDRVGARNMITAHNSTFLHPQLQFFEAGNVSSSMAFWMHEDIFTDWHSASVYSPLTRFIARVLNHVSGTGEWQVGKTYSEEQDIDLSETDDCKVGVVPGNDACKASSGAAM